ncbi:uncharacterized protein LOC113232731 [Hyposmocoma kahamanoa]|uniref:uncharacterized protein LOC113232731 n=1 Tax=Hyposmocoma kahamanoa TaxID=1477025 RepID=UPI000E6D7D52|nr:uncharacterized protein LOC113232731 [Hyposmocoma kahamanoa]
MGNLKTRQLLPINNKWNPEVFVHYRKTKDQYYDADLFSRIEKLTGTISRSTTPQPQMQHQVKQQDADPKPSLGPDPKPSPEPKSEPESGPELGPEPSPEPGPETGPEPGLEPSPESGPEPDPEPSPKTDPEPDSQPSSEPAPESALKLGPEADLESNSELGSNSGSELRPKPGPLPEALKKQVNDRLKLPLHSGGLPSRHHITNIMPLTGAIDIRQHLFIKDLQDLGYLEQHEEGYNNVPPDNIFVNNFYKFNHQRFALEPQTKATQKINLKRINNYVTPKHNALRQLDEEQKNDQGVTSELTWPTFGKKETKNQSPEIDWENFDEEKLFIK